MIKLTFVFRRPKHIADFEEHWANEFVPLVEQLPGLCRVSVAVVIGEPSGPSNFFKLHELYFSDRAALDAALASAQGVQAEQLLKTFAADITTLLFSEHFEEDVRAGTTV